MNETTYVLQAYLSIGLLWVLWHFGWKKYAVEQLRQDLFSVRSQLFDLALRQENGLSFDNKAYLALRSSLNSRIRFAHRITFYHFWLTLGFALIPGLKMLQKIKSYKTPATLEIEALKNPDLVKKMRAIEAQAASVMGKYLLRTSPFFLIVVIGFCLLLAAGLFAKLSFSMLAKHSPVSSFKAAIRIVREEIRKKEETSARAVQIQTDAMEAELELEGLCLAA
jgi:hypothetical protein